MVNHNYSKQIKLPPTTEKQITAFEKHEQEKLEKFCLSSKRKNHIGIIICLYTGIRLGELLALTWDDIDFSSGFLSISKMAYRIKENDQPKIIIDKPKTKSSNRIIPIPQPLLDILKSIKQTSKANYVLSTKTNGIVETRSYQHTYARILYKLNIPYKNFHALRHTFATRAIEMGIDVKTLSEILGHKNPVITLTRYTHSMMSYKIEMMNKMGQMLCAY